MAETPKMATEQPETDVVLTAPEQAGGRLRIFAVPPTIHLGGPTPPKSIRWTNKTGQSIHIWLASVRSYLESTQDLSQPIEVDAGDDLVVGVKYSTEQFEYDYHVFCDAIQNYADGNSPPHVSCP